MLDSQVNENILYISMESKGEQPALLQHYSMHSLNPKYEQYKHELINIKKVLLLDYFVELNINSMWQKRILWAEKSLIPQAFNEGFSWQ